MKRHVYYCRSRASGVIIRTRSCVSCANKKARCDSQRPKCSRCITKGVECHYPTKDTNSAVSPSPTISGTAKSLETASHDDGLVNSALLAADFNAANLGGHQDWATTNLGFTNLWDQGPIDPSVDQDLYGPSSSMYYSTTPANSQSQSQPQRVTSALDGSHTTINRSLSHNTRSLEQRPRVNGSVRGIFRLIFHTLKSYSLMIHQKTLPPFIHPHMLHSMAENDCMEPMNNCMNLMHMTTSGFQGSRNLFWRNVRHECERWCGTVGGLKVPLL